MALLAKGQVAQSAFVSAPLAVDFTHESLLQDRCWHARPLFLRRQTLPSKPQSRVCPAVCARSKRSASRRRQARCEATPQRDSIEAEFESRVQEKATQVADSLGGVNVYLVGMMGSGKSTIGKLLAERLQYRFYDSDEVVERAVGAPIAQIFQENGEDTFRNLETEVLSQLATLTRAVISTGGGAVLRKENWSHMHYGISIFLQVPIHTLAKRVTKAGPSNRPLLRGEDDENDDAETKAFKKLSSIWKDRQGFYESADVTVLVPGSEEGEEGFSTLQLVDEVLSQLEKALKERGVKKAENSTDWMSQL